MNNEKDSMIGINAINNTVCILSRISNLSDNVLTPIIVKMPTNKESSLTKYKLDEGVELKIRKGIINHENKGPQ